jgi:hypothetical protein
MDKEDIFSVEENESLFANLKSKESRPLYLHLKGAFLSAMAIQESENYINTNDPLLSHENDNKDVHEENLTMNENVKDEDILATVEELSQDLSTLSNTKVEESQDPETAPETEEVVEETPVTDAPETEESVKTEQDLENQAVDALKKANEKIAELEAQIAKDSSKAQATDEQESTETVEKTEVPTEEVVDSANAPAEGETQATEESNTNLTDEKVVSEQDVDDATKKLQELEEENKKLKSAMHRTLVERVVDTKIATGIESHELREELIEIT